jgi:hypothetical protein
MSLLTNAAKAFFIPEGQTERFTFKKFDGEALKAYVRDKTPIKASKIQTVALKINPEEVIHDQPRLTQKIQTNFPGRFVIFDWGVDLHVMNIQGHTGNLLPDAVKNSLDPSKPIVDFANSRFGAGIGSLAGSSKGILDMGTQAMLGNISYFELLNMSSKYRTFVKLQNLYLGFDADRDVCTLEFGEFIYRIFFVNFTFTQSANSPWDWTYQIVVNVLADLAEFVRKGDAVINDNGNVERGV